MTQKHTPEPVALMHADWLEKSLTIGAVEASQELRRLHEVERQRDKLLAALVYVIEDLELRASMKWDEDERDVVDIGNGAYEQAKSAISNAKGGEA